jgi:predicted nucleic acid-binding protein
MPLLLVTDTNIWVDLENGEVLESIFSLPYQFVTSDFVGEEIPKKLWESLTSFGVKVYHLNSEQISGIYHLNQTCRSVSITDLSSLVLARDLPAILLSGDKPLRKLAEKQAVEVHGVLWLLDNLIDHQIIQLRQAVLVLKRILATNARLPENECRKRFKRWRGGS